MLGQFKLGLKKSFNDHRDLKLQVEPNKTYMKYLLCGVSTINSTMIVQPMQYAIKLCH